MRYHPRIGYTYMPNTKLRVQGTNGGYLIRTNAAGFRSDREFVRKRAPGTFRVLLFGDSQTAGDGTSNTLRYSDLLEKQVGGVEVYNYGLSGTGTDQQYLTYRDFGVAVEHDLVVIALFVENIRRLRPRLLRSRDVTGEEVYRAKPHYEIGGEGLVLRDVPVPKQAWTAETLPSELLPHVYTYGSEYSFFRNPAELHASLFRRLIPAGALRRTAKKMVARFRAHEPLPEYRSSLTPDWVLLREILVTWIRESRTPVLLVLLPHETAWVPKGNPQRSDPRHYQQRFRELAKETGCSVYDPLPELLKLSEEERATLTEGAHLSVRGHEVMARLLKPLFLQLTAGPVVARAPAPVVEGFP
jgi:lysophospholipase L1-like esterase